MPKTCKGLRRYLLFALVLFLIGAAGFEAIAHFYPRWLADFSWAPAPWDRVVNLVLGGMIAGGLYTGGVWMTRRTEEQGGGGVKSLFDQSAYVGYLLLGPLLFFPAVAIALRRLLSGELPEEGREKITRQTLPRN